MFCSKYAANLHENAHAKVWFPCRCKRLLLTWTVKTPGPEKPRPTKNWTLKNMNPGKHGVNIGGIKKYF